MNEMKRKIFAVFRNPISYIDPLLEVFSRKVELLVAFSVKTNQESSSLSQVKHIYLKNGEGKKYQMGGDAFLVQPEVRRYISKDKCDAVMLATSYWSLST